MIAARIGRWDSLLATGGWDVGLQLPAALTFLNLNQTFSQTLDHVIPAGKAAGWWSHIV